MRLVQSLVLSVALLIGANAATIDLQDRQLTDCEKQYGVYPEYKGPCEYTSKYGSFDLRIRLS